MINYDEWATEHEAEIERLTAKVDELTEEDEESKHSNITEYRIFKRLIAHYKHLILEHRTALILMQERERAKKAKRRGGQR